MSPANEDKQEDRELETKNGSDDKSGRTVVHENTNTKPPDAVAVVEKKQQEVECCFILIHTFNISHL